MRAGYSLHTALPRRLPVVGAVMVLALATACGGGQPSQPTSGPTAAPSAPSVPTPVRPALASPAASPSSVAPAPRPSGTSSGPGQDYTVQAGDTLLSIAQSVYGDSTLWRRIYDANRDTIGPNPDALKLDQKLKIPPKE